MADVDVSIVIPVYNSENCLEELVRRITEVMNKFRTFEIILVNDESEDRTLEVAESFGDRFTCSYRVIDADHSKEDVLCAKTLPLAQGLDAARGELALMTDGDCEVPRTWARAMVSYFTDDVAVVCGVTLPDLSRSPGFPTTWLEAVDWSYLLRRYISVRGFFTAGWHLFGTNHVLYHVVALLVHGCSAFLIYQLGRQLGLSRSGGVLAGLFFVASTVVGSEKLRVKLP